MLQPGEVLEEGCRLSASRIWSLQRRFYEHFGTSAWASGTIPFGATNNPVVGATYARLLAGYLRDVRDQLDPEQPIHLLEIGGGCGQGAFHFLRQWEPLQALPGLRPYRLKYLLTDFTETNLKAYRENPCLQPYFADGRLDVALFDAESDRQALAFGSGNPVIFVANYLLDSLTHDIFWVKQGKLWDGLITLTCKEAVDPDDPRLLTHLEVSYDWVPIKQPYPDKPAWNKVLEFYRTRLTDTAVCFPRGPARCLESMLELSGARMLLLAMDKAFDHLEDLQGQLAPMPVHHGGAFSLTTNFHALELLLQQAGGAAIHSSKRPSLLELSAFRAFGARPQFPELELAFHECVEEVGPVDLYQLRTELASLGKPLPLGLCLELLRLTDHDPDVLRDLSDWVLGVDGTAQEQADLTRSLGRIAANLFPVGVDIREPFADAIRSLVSHV